MNGWQTMETAPRNGTQILTCFHGELVKAWWYQTTFWHQDEERWDQLPKGLEPMFWMPTPPPPHGFTVNDDNTVTRYPRTSSVEPT